MEKVLEKSLRLIGKWQPAQIFSSSNIYLPLKIATMEIAPIITLKPTILFELFNRSRACILILSVQLLTWLILFIDELFIWNGVHGVQKIVTCTKLYRANFPASFIKLPE